VAVSPSQFGLGLYSPRLDERGNSVRGVAASELISGRFSLHLMHQVGRSAPTFERVRPDDAMADSDGPGGVIPLSDAPLPGDIAVLAVQGFLEFASAEQALLTLRGRDPEATPPDAVVIDLSHVTRCHPVAAALLDRMIGTIADRGVTVVTVDRLGRGLLAASAEFATRSEALAHCRALPHDG